MKSCVDCWMDDFDAWCVDVDEAEKWMVDLTQKNSYALVDETDSAALSVLAREARARDVRELLILFGIPVASMVILSFVFYYDSSGSWNFLSCVLAFSPLLVLMAVVCSAFVKGSEYLCLRRHVRDCERFLYWYGNPEAKDIVRFEVYPYTGQVEISFMEDGVLKEEGFELEVKFWQMEGLEKPVFEVHGDQIRVLSPVQWSQLPTLDRDGKSCLGCKSCACDDV